MPKPALKDFSQLVHQLLNARDLGLPLASLAATAETEALRAKKTNPENSFTLLGVVAFVRGRESDVRDFFKRAILASGGSAAIRLRYAELLMFMGAPEEAAEQIRAILDAEPTSKEIMHTTLHICYLCMLDDLFEMASSRCKKLDFEMPVLPLVSKTVIPTSSAAEAQDIAQDPFVQKFFELAQDIKKRKAAYVGA